MSETAEDDLHELGRSATTNPLASSTWIARIPLTESGLADTITFHLQSTILADDQTFDPLYTPHGCQVTIAPRKVD
ncbi:hypothetical protein LTR53_000827 [Teratosphaeriaceae sp. CCFEE 6253]|nr:hypothetical protein LTR53_000827 [Teratosphaeriaceae sp. CCFEE 6253]